MFIALSYSILQNWGLHVRRLGICGHGYGYGWKISYPRQAWFM